MLKVRTDVLLRIMHDCGWNRKRLALEIGIAPSQISRVLRGTRNLGPHFIAGLHRAGHAWDAVLIVEGQVRRMTSVSGDTTHFRSRAAQADRLTWNAQRDIQRLYERPRHFLRDRLSMGGDLRAGGPGVSGSVRQ